MNFSVCCEFPQLPLKCYFHVPDMRMCFWHSNSKWPITLRVDSTDLQVVRIPRLTLSSLPTRGCLPSSVVSLPLISPTSDLKWSWPLFVDESLTTKALLSSAGWHDKHLLYCTAFSVPITTAIQLQCDSCDTSQVVGNTYPERKPLLHTKCQNMRCILIVKKNKTSMISVSAVDLDFRLLFLWDNA